MRLARQRRRGGRNCKVTDGTDSGRAGSRPARKGALLVILASVLLLVGSTVVGYLLGRDLARRPLASALQLLQQLQPEAQKFKAKIDEQTNVIIGLETKLKRTEAILHSILPKENTYTVLANQSISVAGGHILIGLIGAPRNNGITLNINGKQHQASTGDMFAITPDPATNCQVKVQSFDMFEATIYANCAKAQPK